MKKKGTFIEEARRKQVLDIALKIITKHGWRQTTIDMIAEQASTSKGVIYYHFGGKKQLTAAIWKTILNELYEYRKSRVDKQISASDKLKTYIKANFEFFFGYERKKNLCVMFEAGVDLTANNGRNPWSPALNARCFDFIVEILKEGQARGEFDSFSPEKVAPVIQSVMDGIFLAAYSDPEGTDWLKCQQVAEEMILSYVSC